MDVKNCFFAYPSQHLPIVYSIQHAITTINNAGYGVRVKDWQTMSVAGKFIIDEIRIAIDDSDVFMCDLTYFNMNVLFELGYAIANDKRIWISINEDLFDKEKIYEELGLISTIGYRQYKNDQDLAWGFIEDAPFNDLSNTLFRTCKSITPQFGPKGAKSR